MALSLPSVSSYPLVCSEAVSYFPTLSNLLNTKTLSSSHASDKDLLSTLNPSPLTKWELSLHYHLPKIHAKYAFYYALDRKPACDVFVVWGNGTFCSVEEFERDRNLYTSNSFDKPISIDHTLNPNHASDYVTLYANIFSPKFTKFHDYLSKLSFTDHVSYTLRYIPHSGTVSVQGYQVELMIKSQEYKVIDDRSSDPVSDEPGIYNDPELKDDELEAKMEKLTGDEIKDLSLLSIFHILSTPGWLKSGYKLSSDFPKFASDLKKYLVEPAFMEFKQDMERKFAGERFRDSMDGIESLIDKNSKNLVWVNGINVDLTQLDLFKYYGVVKRELEIMRVFEGFGVAPNVSRKLLVTSDTSVRDVKLEGFDLRFDKIVWFNDLERDSMYRLWPGSVAEYMTPSWSSPLKYVAKNAFSVLICLDVGKVNGEGMVLRQLLDLIDREVPLRIGFVPVFEDGERGKVGRVLARVIYHLLEMKNGRKLLKNFIFSLQETLATATPLSESINAVYQKTTSQQIPPEIFVDEDDDLINKLSAYKRRFGLDRGGAFLNGMPLKLTEQWSQDLLQLYQLQLEHLQNLIHKKEIDDSTDLSEYFSTLPGFQKRRNMYLPSLKSVDAERTVVDVIKHSKELLNVKYLGCTDGECLVTILLSFDAGSVDTCLEALSALEEEQVTKYTRIGFLPFGAKIPCENVNTVSECVGELSGAKEVSEVPENKGSELLQELGIKTGLSAVIVNGLLYGPIPVTESLKKEDYVHLATSHRDHAQSILSVVTDIKAPIGDLVQFAEAIKFSEQGKTVRRGFAFNHEDLVLKKGDENSAVVIDAACDPASEIGQVVFALLHVMNKFPNVGIRVELIPSFDLKEIPVKRFYRMVYSTELKFDENGKLVDQLAVFENVPKEPLLTMNVLVPGSWLVAPIESVYDLDNLRVTTSQTVEAIYELKNILVQGHARDPQNGPPRGTQFELIPLSPYLAKSDTITMANLGYLQLKANPGIWALSLRPGASTSVYELERVKGVEVVDGKAILVVDSFEGVTVFPRVKHQLGMEGVDVLNVDDSTLKVQKESGIQGAWNFVSKKLFGKKDGSIIPKKHAEINIFSVASGHLYERFLGIMILSVMKNTNSTVKFWLIENFLSPSFKEFLPHFAEVNNFEYEFITYKWPHWLREQTEKQRIIWGYKILFLDVMFPLSLDKVIFVDADQVVRTDMIELVNLDLKNAVYGYTPFCDSRKEMDGFRFWTTGYWKSHLQGRPYHISALYVVDLKRFRAFAAGDRLRQQYQMLSADPQSLSNLDQDLPNNMIHSIPMISLPQEWLWCETWCSDEELTRAKTIDLCNNPQTKEPKLERAKRILPEWEGLDREVQELVKKSSEKKDRKNKIHDEL